ncbi:MAG: hypothetical protein IPN92_08940 [Chromatiaceae bacterium]|nr:hypothetical protein [Chromatiaceae bacterium]
MKAVPEAPPEDTEGQSKKADESPADKRRRELTEQHGPEIAEAIIARTVINGMTFEQVLMIRGTPTGKQVIPPDAELWRYPDGEIAFSAGRTSYVGLSGKKDTARPVSGGAQGTWGQDTGNKPPADSSLTIPRPSVRVGDSYVYETRDPANVEPLITTKRTVTTADKEIVLSTVALNSKNAKTRRLYFDRDWNLVRSRNADNSGLDYSPPIKYYDFPLYPGKKWQQVSTETDIKSGKIRMHTISGIVGDWEDVAVPAGNFRAMRVSLETEVFDSATGEKTRGTDISWYVPEVRRSVKSITSGKDGKSKIIQLMSYQLSAQR